MMSTSFKNTSSNITASMAGLQLNHPATPEIQSASDHKAVVVGIYGIPGSGKTFLLNQLKQELGETQFAFYEGSNVIDAVVPGGLEEFKRMEGQEKADWRERAIKFVGEECTDSAKVAVVAGHYMFWKEGQEARDIVCTQEDLKVFTHILYLDVSAEVVVHQRLGEPERGRAASSADHLRKWQQEEKTQLRSLCRDHEILFSLVSPSPALLDKVSILLQDFRCHTEKYNQSRAEIRLDDVVVASQGQLETMLVIDADKTLAAEDTGALFWKSAPKSWALEHGASTLKALFSSRLGYSYTAFRQAVLLYEETANDEYFDVHCQAVASAVIMHPDFVSLLHLVAEQKHVGAVVVTCGLRRVWDKVLKREGLSEKVEVIGGGRIADGFIVSAAVKEALVARLQDFHRMRVWAFGDSPLDLGMLRKADHAIIVVGEEQTRSKSMDELLTHAIDVDGLKASQAVLPSNASPRQNNKLPIINLTDPNFVTHLLGDQYTHGGLQVLLAKDRNAAKLLATRMRDAAVSFFSNPSLPLPSCSGRRPFPPPDTRHGCAMQL